MLCLRRQLIRYVSIQLSGAGVYSGGDSGILEDSKRIHKTSILAGW